MALTQAERAAFLDRYEAGPGLLRSAWTAVPVEARQWRPSAGKWSAHEVVVHCADSETFAATRIRLLLAEPEPLIVGYDENEWARAFDYHRSDIDLALDVVAQVRSHTASMFRRLDDPAWDKVGRHTHSGVYGTGNWLRNYAEHLEVHAAQIQRNLNDWSAGPA